MDPQKIDVKQPEGDVTPSLDDQPLTGQPDPEEVASSEPQPDGNEDGDKTVPLAALHEERTKRQQLQAELEVLRQIAGDNVLFDVNGRPVPRQYQPQPQQQQAPQQQHNHNAEMEKLWEEDPRRAVQAEIMAAMSWRDNLDAQVDQQEIIASQRYSDYGEYRDTIRQYIRALPINQRSQEGVVDLAYYVVKGQKANDAYARGQADALARIRAGNGVQGLRPGTMSPAPKPKGNQPTEEMRKVADAMGMSIEDYMSAMKNQGV